MRKQKIPKAYGMLLSYIRSTHYFMLYYYLYKSNIIRKSNLKNMCKLLIQGAIFDAAVISWCRLFGNEKVNDTHWKNIFNDHALAHGCHLIGISSPQGFRSNFLSKAKITEKDFEKLHKEMSNYRNKIVAHHDMSDLIEGMDLDKLKTLALGITNKMPNLNLAKRTILALYSIIGEVSIALVKNDYWVLNHYVPPKIFDKVMKSCIFE